MEHVLLLLFLSAGIYMFWGAREFSSAAAEFPRLMAGATAVLSFLILARNYLRAVAPIVVTGLGIYWLYVGGTEFVETGEGVILLAVGAAFVVAGIGFRKQVGESAESFVAEPMQVLGDKDVADVTDDGEIVEDNDEEDEGEADSGAMYVYEIDDPRGPVVTGVLCIVYMILTFSIGMLYATPIFVAMWAAWVRMSPLRAFALILISFVTAYLFYDFISSDIAEGWLTGWAPTPPDDILGLSVYVVDLFEWGVIFV